MDAKATERLELTLQINSIIADMRGVGVYDPLYITLELNKRIGLDLTVLEVTTRIQAYKESLVYGMLDNYKDNVINAMEKYIFIYNEAINKGKLKLAKDTLDSILKLQQIDNFDIYEKFGVKTNSQKIDKSEGIRSQKIIKLTQKKPSIGV